MGAISRGLQIIWDKKQFLLHPPLQLKFWLVPKKHPKCLTVLIWKENQSSVLSGAVARLDLLGGGGQSRAPKARGAWGVRGHAPQEDFEL